MKLTLLDCTLRDGGYYCNWDFDKSLVEKYLASVSGANIDVVELGLRSPNSKGFYGPYAYTSEQFINSFDIPRNITLGVMINTKEYSCSDGSINEKLLYKNFVNKNKSKVTLVRIASHFSEQTQTIKLIKALTDLGYTVGVNLMQVGGRDSNEVLAAVDNLMTNCNFEVLYFADSFGNLNSSDVENLYNLVRIKYSGALGIHAHDNMGRAVSNSLKAIDCGVTWVDGTVLGMGRGAGNAQMEILSLEVKERGFTKYNPDSLYPIVLNEFGKLKKEYQWGKSLLYYLAAKYNIHPTYVQEMLSGKTESEDIISAITKLRENKSTTSFSKGLLQGVVENKLESCDGSWKPKEAFENKDVLVIGAGPSVKKHKEGIEDYIRIYKPLVVSLNINENIDPELIDIYSASHPVKLFSEISQYKKLNKPLIVPFNSLDNKSQLELESVDVLNYGLKREGGAFVFNESYCVVPSSLVFGYVLSAMTAGNASSIKVVGFDGYSGEDRRNVEMETLIRAYKETKDAINIVSLTPTKYPLEESSIYYPG